MRKEKGQTNRQLRLRIGKLPAFSSYLILDRWIISPEGVSKNDKTIVFPQDIE